MMPGTETLIANVAIIVLEWLLTRPAGADVTPEQAAKARDDFAKTIQQLKDKIDERLKVQT